MKKLLTTLAILALTVPLSAHAEPKRDGPHHRVYSLGTLLSAVALDGAASTRTFNLPSNVAAGHSMMLLHLFFDHTTNGTITTQCYSTNNAAGTQDNIITTCAVVSGACTLQQAGSYTTWTMSADTRWAIPVGIHGYHDIECSVTHNNTPVTADTITVEGWLITQ